MEAKRTRRHGHPRRPAVHAHLGGGRPPRADPGRLRHRVPRRPGQPRAEQRPRLPRVRRRLHQRRERSSTRASRTPRTSTGCSPASTRRPGTTTRRRGATSARRRPRTSAARRSSSADEPAPTRQAVARGGALREPRLRRRARSTGRAAATRRCRTRAACSRSSSGTSRATPRRWCSEVCGIAPGAVPRGRRRADRATAGASGPRAFCYAVGWTHHSVGAQMIRTAAILQTLLGNIGRPGGGIMALRGHASIQGSTDIPTLFNILPGYLPMPHARPAPDRWTSGSRDDEGKAGFWGNMRSYAVSLLKAYWGDAATADNDFCFDYLPRLTGDHSTYTTVKAQIEGALQGLLPGGGEPRRRLGERQDAAPRPGQPRLARGARPADDRVGDVLEGRPRDRDRRAGHRGDRHRDLLPARRLARREGRLVHPDPADAAVARQGRRPARRRAQRAGLLLRARPADPREARRAPPTRWTGRCWTSPGTTRSTSTASSTAEAVLREINGTGPDGAALSAYTELKADGSTACGCWIYCGVYADEVNQAAAPQAALGAGPRSPPSGAGCGRPTGGSSTTAPPPPPTARPWSERKKYVWWDAEQGRWTGARRAGLHRRTGRPTTCPSEGAKGPDAIGGHDPFVMQTDGKAWLFAPLGRGRRADAHPLRAAGVAGAQPALPPAEQPLAPPRSTDRGEPDQPELQRGLPLRLHHATGSPSTTPPAP